VTVEVRANDLGGWSGICPAHGVVAQGPDRLVVKLSSLIHEDKDDQEAEAAR
jgi:hypothetical protein